MVRKSSYYLAFVVIVAVMLGAIIYVFTHDDPKTDKPQPTAGSSIQDTEPKVAGDSDRDAQKKTDTNSADTQSDAATDTPAATTPSRETTTPSTAAPNGSEQLANSGPGDVLALFLGAVVVGAVGFSRYQRKSL